MDEREDRQAVSTKGGVISHRPCCTPPAQCCYKRKEDNGRGMKDIKHDVRRRRRREREEMFWPRVHGADEAGGQTQSVSQSARPRRERRQSGHSTPADGPVGMLD